MDITKLRRIALDGISSSSASNNSNNSNSSDDAGDEEETLARQAAQEAFDVEFTDILARFGAADGRAAWLQRGCLRSSLGSRC